MFSSVPKMESDEAVVRAGIILEALRDAKVMRLVRRTLQEDFITFNVPRAESLADITVSRLCEADTEYPRIAESLALDTYANWDGGSIREKYHNYNWHVERKGSAQLVSSHIRGGRIWDLGGGPGTFALELLEALPNPNASITITDIMDWRVDRARSHPRIGLKLVKEDDPLPFEAGEFDSATIMYCLHHFVIVDRLQVLKRVAEICTKTVVIFEDVLVDTSKEIPAGTFRPQRAIFTEFLKFPLTQQHRYMAAVDYICNHIASQALTMPMPCEYWEFREFEQILRTLFPHATVSAHFHGMYDTKCFPNPEAMYVIQL